ncbi:hypothetical protein TNCV_4763781 [Trichonephila clavipes]|nr:hypothetical protein TNCV_4763781 [Trichonephila clavipes]
MPTGSEPERRISENLSLNGIPISSTSEKPISNLAIAISSPTTICTRLTTPFELLETECVLGSLVVEVTNSWQACHEFKPSTTEEPQYKGEMYVLICREHKLPPISVVIRRGVPAQLSSLSLDHGSKLRRSSPKVLVQLSIRTHERTRGRKVASSSPVATEDPPYKWVRGSVSTFWCSVVGKGSLAQVSSSLLDRGSKLEVRPNSPSSTTLI